MRETDWREPFKFSDGRIFDVLDFDIRHAPIFEPIDYQFEKCCVYEVQEGKRQMFIEFWVYFTYRDSQAADATLLHHARRRVHEYLLLNRQQVPISRCCKPTIIKLR